MSIHLHRTTVGDTLTKLAVQLVRDNADGDETPVDVSAANLRVKGVKEDGTTWIAETATGVLVNDATLGQVQYTFQTADVATAGIYYMWFVVISGGARDTFPHDGRGIAVDVTPAEP